MSRHPLDRFALAVGVPLVALGLYGVIDDTGIVDDNAWLWVALLVLAGIGGVVAAVVGELRVRARQQDHDPDPSPG